MKSWNSESYKLLVGTFTSDRYRIAVNSVVDIGGLPTDIRFVDLYLYNDDRDVFHTWERPYHRGYVCEANDTAKMLSGKFRAHSCCNVEVQWNAMFVVTPNGNTHPGLGSFQVCPLWVEKHMPDQFDLFFVKIAPKVVIGEREPLEDRLKPYFVLPGCADGSESLEKAIQGVMGAFVREQHENSRTGRCEILNPVVGKVSAPPVVSQRGTCIPWWEREGLAERPMWTDR